MRYELSEIPLWGWIAIAVLMLSQSTFLFLDAQKRNANPWLWGIWGLIQCPTPLVIYFIFVRKIFKKSGQK